MIKWLKWWFGEARRCQHQESTWKMIESGMRKLRYCNDCGKTLELL